MSITYEPPSVPWLTIDGISLHSRLLIGFEQYRSPSIIKRVLEASGVEIIILQSNRWYKEKQENSPVDISRLSEIVDLSKYLVIGTTSSAINAKEAIDLALLLCESLKTRIVKLDVRLSSAGQIYPNNQQTLEAAKELIQQSCVVLPMISPDLVTASLLEEVGCAALRILAGAIGKNSGITNQHLIKTITSRIKIPVIAEGGISRPSDVNIAMESGAAAVLVNTAIAQSSDPVETAKAMRASVMKAWKG